MGVFERMIASLQSAEVFTIGAPAVLVFSIVYGIISKIDFFNNPAVNLVSSISFSAIIVGGLYRFIPGGLLPNFAAYIGVSLVGIFGFIVLLGFSENEIGNNDFLGYGAKLLGAGALVLTFLLYFPESLIADLVPGAPRISFSQSFVNVFLIVSGLSAVVALIVAGDDNFEFGGGGTEDNGEDDDDD